MVIEQQTGQAPRRPVRSDPPSPGTVLHRLGVVRTRLAIDDAFAVANLERPAWIMEQDQNPDARPDSPAHKRYVLYEAFGRGDERVTCRPDASAWLKLPGNPPWNLVLYVEYDRSTQTHTEMLQKKVPGYATLLHPCNRGHRRHWRPSCGARGGAGEKVARDGWTAFLERVFSRGQ